LSYQVKNERVVDLTTASTDRATEGSFVLVPFKCIEHSGRFYGNHTLRAKMISI